MRLSVLFILMIGLQAYAEEPVDYVNLGATLLKDGYVQRAKTVLEKADVRQRDFDFKQYYTLKGVLYHRLGYPVISNIFFNEAVARGQDNPSIYIYVARNHWQKRNYPEIIEALDKAGPAALENQPMYVIKAEAYKQMGDLDKAWSVLDAGIEKFPDYSKFYRQKFYYLVDLGFFQAAEQYAEKYLEVENYSVKDYLAVAYTLRQNKQLKSAAKLLERGVIKHPNNDKLLELLGQVYIDQEEYMMAALVFDWASITFPRFAHKAASLYLESDDPIRSLQLNRRIVAQDDKFRQRLGIDIYLEDYESLAAKDEVLKRYDLLSDDNIAYALGFAYYRIRDYDNAAHYLKTIDDNQLFAKASQLFKQIEKCKNEPLECR